MDCSVVMSWCFEDEAGALDKAVYAALFFDHIPCHVPLIFYPEVANTLLVGERRGRCASSKADEFLQNLLALPIIVDDHTASHLVRDVHELSRRHQLTAYDGYYLELALRRGLPIATHDRALIAAARLAQLEVLSQ